jgi:hypothetical protein
VRGRARVSRTSYSVNEISSKSDPNQERVGASFPAAFVWVKKTCACPEWITNAVNTKGPPPLGQYISSRIARSCPIDIDSVLSGSTGQRRYRSSGPTRTIPASD